MELEVQLRQDGAIRDRRIQKVGLRTIVLDTGPVSEPGTSFFRFVLNGVPIFARGANWIPASSFVGALDRADYERLIETAIEANMNMLFSCGAAASTSTTPSMTFATNTACLSGRTSCLACAPYPEDDPNFVATVRAELDFQIKRLRNHPCLSLWCGNNEGQVIHEFAGRLQGRSGSLFGEPLFRAYHSRCRKPARSSYSLLAGLSVWRTIVQLHEGGRRP